MQLDSSLYPNICTSCQKEIKVYIYNVITGTKIENHKCYKCEEKLSYPWKSHPHKPTFLEYTYLTLLGANRHPSQVQWVGDETHHPMSWHEFEMLTKECCDTDYNIDSVPEDLVIVGESWWLKIINVDSRRWWVFNQKPEKPVGATEPLRLR